MLLQVSAGGLRLRIPSDCNRLQKTASSLKRTVDADFTPELFIPLTASPQAGPLGGNQGGGRTVFHCRGTL